MNIDIKLNRKNQYLEKRLKETFSNNPHVNLSFSNLSLENIDILVTIVLLKRKLSKRKNYKYYIFIIPVLIIYL